MLALTMIPKVHPLRGVVTLADVARAARVSAMTVSRVINGRPDVRPGTRRRVLRAVERLNYEPSRPARALATRTTRVLGLIPYEGQLPLFACPFYQDVMRGVEMAAAELGYDVLLFTPMAARSSYHRLVARSMAVDGGLILGIRVNAADVRALARQRFPFVLIGRRNLGRVAYSFVAPDYVSGAREAVQHLLAHNHRRIGVIVERKRFEPTMDKLLGVRRELQRAGARPPRIAEGGCGRQGGVLAMRTLLRSPERPAAVIATSIPLALGAMDALREAGARVPSDVALVAFDDDEAARYVEPPLTVVQLPKVALGEVATRMLVDLLRDGMPEPPARLLPTALIIRESSGGSGKEEVTYG